MSTSNPLPASGLIPVDKPAGYTSHDIVALVRKFLPAPRPKVGHTGTLDPFATGLLLVAFGPATRLVEYTRPWPKTYLVKVRLGAVSDTDDSTGKITKIQNVDFKQITKAQIINKLNSFTGTIRQTPPTYSAKKIKGRRLYELARESRTQAERDRLAGEKVSTVTIHSIKIISLTGSDLVLEVNCGSGTYLRSLARDIGQALGTGAYAAELRRIQTGPIDINQAIQPDIFSLENFKRIVLPPEILVQHLPSLILSDPNVAKLSQGQTVEWGNVPEGEKLSLPSSNQPLAVFNPSKKLASIALFDPATSLLHPQKNLVP